MALQWTKSPDFLDCPLNDPNKSSEERKKGQDFDYKTIDICVDGLDPELESEW